MTNQPVSSLQNPVSSLQQGVPKKKKKKKMKSTRNLEIWRELEEKKYDNIFPLIDGS
jgi:hypothetical protein